MQLAMSSRTQEAVNWSWLVPKGWGPKSLFRCSASGRCVDVGTATHSPGCRHSPPASGSPEDGVGPPALGHLTVPSRDGPVLPAWPSPRPLGRCDSPTRSQTSGPAVATGPGRTGSMHRSHTEAAEHETAAPAPHPEAFQSHRLNHIVTPKPSLTAEEIFSRCSKRPGAVQL